jgi:glycosyltransferase involved in cell wall biosynthesis
MRVRYVARRLAEVTALRAANSRIATNIVSSNYMRQELVRSGYPPSRVAVIPLGVDIPAVDLSTVTRSHDVPCILVAGRLVRQKGVQVLLRALALVDQPFHLLIVGHGPMYPALKQVAKNLRLESQVSFLGWADGTRLLADTAPDLVVMPSLVPETFGLAGVEALAHGIPVVAFASGAIPEWLTDGETGWLAAPGSVVQLTAALRKALSATSHERRSMGARGRAYVRSHFSVADYSRSTVDCYRRSA